MIFSYIKQYLYSGSYYLMHMMKILTLQFIQNTIKSIHLSMDLSPFHASLLLFVYKRLHHLTKQVTFVILVFIHLVAIMPVAMTVKLTWKLVEFIGNRSLLYSTVIILLLRSRSSMTLYGNCFVSTTRLSFFIWTYRHNLLTLVCFCHSFASSADNDKGHQPPPFVSGYKCLSSVPISLSHNQIILLLRLFHMLEP